MREDMGVYRGKRRDNGEWIEGCYVLRLDIGRGAHFITVTDHMGTFMWYEVDPTTVGQFTGLVNKDGKKVFEGDIACVTRGRDAGFGWIAFRNGCFWSVDDGLGDMFPLCKIPTEGFEIRVIGNIYDDPELLDGGADDA